VPRQLSSTFAAAGKALWGTGCYFKAGSLDGNAHIERAPGAFAAVGAVTVSRRTESSGAGEPIVCTKASAGDGSAHARLPFATTINSDAGHDIKMVWLTS